MSQIHYGACFPRAWIKFGEAGLYRWPEYTQRYEILSLEVYEQRDTVHERRHANL